LRTGRMAWGGERHEEEVRIGFKRYKKINHRDANKLRVNSQSAMEKDLSKDVKEGDYWPHTGSKKTKEPDCVEKGLAKSFNTAEPPDGIRSAGGKSGRQLNRAFTVSMHRVDSLHAGREGGSKRKI